MEPAKVDATKIFALKKEAAEKLEENTELIQKRQDKLLKDGAFRVHVPKGKGLRKRIDATSWTKNVSTVDSFPNPGEVKDQDGKVTLTKLTRAVPQNSSALVARPRREAEDMTRFAQILADKLPGLPQHFTQAAKLMKAVPGFTDALKASRQTFKEFVNDHQDLLQVHDGRIRSRQQQTL